MLENPTGSSLSVQQARLSLAALFTSIFFFCISFCISFGGLTPLIALVLEQRDVDGAVIGLVVAAQPIDTMLAPPFVPALLRRFGTADTILLCGVASVVSAALLPILLARQLAPRLEVVSSPGYRRILTAAPTLFAAAVFAGVVDIAFFSFLPIWGLRNGLEETFALTLLTVFVAGNIVLQYPLGWIADVLGYRAGMMLCGLVCLLGPAVAPLLLGAPLLLLAVLFVWGGAAWGVYSIALAALGVRFRGGLLAAANAVFVIAFEVANIFGPPLAGGVLDLWPRHGLMAMMGLSPPHSCCWSSPALRRCRRAMVRASATIKIAPVMLKPPPWREAVSSSGLRRSRARQKPALIFSNSAIIFSRRAVGIGACHSVLARNFSTSS